MKLLAAMVLLTGPLQAGLKWERTSQTINWKAGQSDAVVEFAYKNATKNPQKITELKGACVCCTSASASRKNVGPGETGVVRMRLDFRGKKLPTAKAITVTTDDGNVVSLVLQVNTPGGKEVSIPRWNFRK